MKKILFFAVAALFVSISVFAQEQDQEKQVDIQQAQPAPAQTQTQKDEKPIEFHMNFTNFGAGIFMTPFSIYGSIELLSFGVEHKKTGLGASFSPFNLFGYIGFNADAIDNNDSKNDDYGGYGYDTDPSTKLGEVIPADGGISIINLTVYWNLISLISENEKFFMAPFIGFNYLFMGQTMDPSKYFFTAGFQGGIRGGSEKVKYNIFSVETGFRAINGDPKFFATIKFDFIMSLLNL
jgi:hypothetical protein